MMWESHSRPFQREVPMLLGRISEKTRMRMVMAALMIPNQYSPERVVA